MRVIKKYSGAKAAAPQPASPCFAMAVMVRTLEAPWISTSSTNPAVLQQRLRKA